MSPAMKRSQRWRLVITVVTIVAMSLLVIFAWDQILATFRELTEVNSGVLFLMIPLQAANYHFYAKLYRSMLAILDEKVEYKQMYKVALELNFVNNVFPSGGVSTFSYFSIRMKDFNIPGAKATLVQFMRFILVFISFQILMIVGLIMLALGGDASNIVILITSVLATLLLVFTLTAAYVVGSKRRINNFLTLLTRGLNRLFHLVRPRHPETINIDRAQRVFSELHENYVVLKGDYSKLKKPLLYALGGNLTEILTIYVAYLAFGHWVNPGAIIIAYAVANFAGIISILPGGVGIYEALTTAVLAAAGIPASLGFSATVLYRVLSMSIQIPPGYYFYYKFTHPKRQVGASS